jgi:hypothetical protein
MMTRSLPTAPVVAFLMLVTGVVRTDCTPDNPTGQFQGTAVSQQAGKLDISLELRCVNRRYQGELVTPVGTYTIETGTYAGRELQLQLVSGADSISMKAQFEEQGLHGQFTAGDDSGPVDLRRTGEARQPASTQGWLHVSPQHWDEDIDFFARELPQRHANAFHHLSREQFEAAIADLKHRLPHMNGDAIYVALDRIANSIGDAHTYVEFPGDTANFPLGLAKFGADYRVVAVGPGFERALGARVANIGDTSAAQARELAAAMAPATETTALADVRAVGFLTMGITLHGLGIIANRNVASYELVEDNGQKFTMSFPAIPPDSQINWVNLVNKPPLRQQNPNQDFWFVYLPDSHSLYCNFRSYQRLNQNAAALLSDVKAKNADKLVIDLRQNSGGDYTQGLKYLIDPIRGLSKINRSGHLFVLIGANTFSAAMSNAAQFRQRTAAMLVGEPVGERPNSYQEAREMRLPNSQLRVRYSTQYYKFSDGAENLIRPDHEVAIPWEDYKKGRDPVLEWALQYK